jgi:dsDNA-specific endonuclease/ATPase MutS2
MKKDDDSPFEDPIVLPITDTLDLHAFEPKEIVSVVEEYLEECRRVGFSEVRVIHGKGIGVQRNIVRSVLNKHPAVASYQDAPIDAGSWGATIVRLKEQNPS